MRFMHDIEAVALSSCLYVTLFALGAILVGISSTAFRFQANDNHERAVAAYAAWFSGMFCMWMVS